MLFLFVMVDIANVTNNLNTKDLFYIFIKIIFGERKYGEENLFFKFNGSFYADVVASYTSCANSYNTRSE